ncbi:GntR family transcriptional regulator [Subtercola endophyticus]|uniref:GntR family transcriptional regulator n=1 Tax=Subtercola endophyticus TaxID=2895559 RepID=UPI001E49E481|nr:GntR family transcriptional regulator [Subtercola endophyticus]UFS58719.1 GntR family transcriptional regulator [Subtercola endophyticus]
MPSAFSADHDASRASDSTLRSRRSASAYSALREAIMENALKPGMKLPEEDLGTHFGVSRTLIRAALAQLSLEGLVDIGKTKSATVAQPTKADALEAFEVRRALEREVCRLVANRWNAEMGETLAAHLAAEKAASDEHNHKVSIRLGAEFHILLADMAGNALLRRYLFEVVGRTTLILAVYGQAHPQQDSLDEHILLVEALGRGDSAAAEAIVDAHIQSVEDRALGGADSDESPQLAEILSRYSRPS